MGAKEGEKPSALPVLRLVLVIIILVVIIIGAGHHWKRAAAPGTETGHRAQRQKGPLPSNHSGSEDFKGAFDYVTPLNDAARKSSGADPKGRPIKVRFAPGVGVKLIPNRNRGYKP